MAVALKLSTAPAVHDAWFRAKVQEALDDPRPAIPYEDVEAHFAKRRAAALRKAGEGDACVDFERKSVEK
jgi:DNA-damage-inducible protein J